VSAIKKASKIVFPGVGHFAKAVKELKQRRIFELLKERIEEGVPFLGICLGMQLLFEKSEEAEGVKGLAVIEGQVKRFKIKGLIVPHMGWNKVKIKNPARLAGRAKIKDSIIKGVKDNTYFYFAHSYYCCPREKEAMAATTDYGVEFASCVQKDNIYGVQFHPEKSQAPGLKVFDNFLSL
jgi:imidazole glycerol-phosphate synthase subunit HisH